MGNQTAECLNCYFHSNNNLKKLQANKFQTIDNEDLVKFISILSA